MALNLKRVLWVFDPRTGEYSRSKDEELGHIRGQRMRNLGIFEVKELGRLTYWRVGLGSLDSGKGKGPGIAAL